MDWRFWLIAVVGTVGILALSYGFARLGHPESAWFWCDVAHLCQSGAR